MLETLLLPSTFDLKKDIDFEFETIFKHGGFLSFDEAFELYIDNTEFYKHGHQIAREDTLKSQFLIDLLNDKYGVRCFVVTIGDSRYLVLDNDEVNIPSIIEQVILKLQLSHQKKERNVDHKFIRDSLASLDSEFDKRICKALLVMLLNPEDQKICGINPFIGKRDLSKMKEALEEVESAEVAANDLVKLRIRDRLNKLDIKLKSYQKKKATHKFSNKRLGDINSTIRMIEEHINKEQSVLRSENPYEKQKFQQCVKRMVSLLIKENRIKNRKSGAGAKPLLDTEDEEYIARAIESMCSAHGRHHDPVMYLNHRLKCRDLLSIANHSLASRGKKLIKSARTVLLRPRPKKINSREGERHKG